MASDTSPFQRAQKLIQAYVKVLKQEGIPVDLVWLYGSYAKGKAGPDSDVDVCGV